MKWIKIITVTVCLALSLTACGKGGEIKPSSKPFPEISATDTSGNAITNDIFGDYEITLVNFWNNSCGTCIEEMPELEEYYQDLKEQGINIIGVASDAGESDEKLDFAKKVLTEKGVTYTNIVPDVNGTFYQDFISDITGFPTSYLVDRDGNIIGAPIVGNVKRQHEKLMEHIEMIRNQSK